MHIPCPKCKQDTHLSEQTGLDGLEDDYIMHNILDMVSIEQMALECTSCKVKEKAVARCSDCAQFLCSGCVSAHHFMICFENHKVVQFEEIISAYKANLSKKMELEANGDENEPSASFNRLQYDCGVPIHKPLFCKYHNKGVLKFFCSTCQTPICSECVVSVHQAPMHSTERISEVELRNVDELDSMLRKAKDNACFCQSEFQTLDQCSADLHEQFEASRGFINETFESYKMLLEKRRVNLSSN
jgi:hypothetical protein